MNRLLVAAGGPLLPTHRIRCANISPLNRVIAIMMNATDMLPFVLSSSGED
jgi:hypothetical protein